MKKAWSRKNLWDNLPPAMKSAVGSALSIVPVKYYFGRRFRQCLRFLDRAQWWSIQQARHYQLQQLRRILTLAYEKTSFYRELFDHAGFDPAEMKTVDDLAALPTIDKTTIQQHLADMCTVPPDSPSVDFASTGGTSGNPLHFYINADRSAAEYAHLTASWQRIGYRLDMPLAVFRGRVVAPDRTGFRHQYDPLLRHHYYSNFHMTDDNMKRYLDHVRTIGPCFLHVYPSSAATLTQFIRRTGIDPPDNVRGIIAESEIVYPDQRRAAEQTFNCRFFSCYGHSEKLALAAECEHSSDYHVWPTYGYFELLDENGRPVTTPGRQGEIVATGFINTVVPFIRYRTGDYATYVADRCRHCNRQHTLIRDITGHRVQEFLITADGSQISWTAMNMHDDTFLNVRRFQFYQDTPGRAILRIVPAEPFCERDKQRITTNLNRKLDGQVRFTIQLTDDIPLTDRGKTIYVDQRIPTAAGHTHHP